MRGLWRNIVVAAVAAAVCGCVRGALHTSVDRGEFPVKGIDVSSHNGNIDFEAAKADTVTFVLIKATEGTDFSDAMFDRNHQAASKAGLKVGAYHYFRFDSPGHLQAYHFLSAVEGKKLDMPLAVDVEEYGNAEGCDAGRVADELRAMADVMAACGRRVMVYTNKQGFERYVEPAFPDSLPWLWISSPSGRPARGGWTLWQHSHQGAVEGLRGPVDLNTYAGTDADFESWLSE